MYKNLRILYGFIAALWLLPLLCMGQDLPNDVADKISSSIARQYKNYPREKIFVHTNAQVYTSGQTIWYKVYAQAYGKPSAISHIVYLQLTDPSGNVVSQSKLPLKDGMAHGNIDLSAKLKTGWYQLRSFTAWMANFGSDEFFSSKIFIQGADGFTTNTSDKIPKKYHIDFYPEGGIALNDNECVFAFKATGPDGLPAPVRGQVLDNSNQKMADVATVHDGMGQFKFQGYAGRVYKAVVQFADNSQQTVTLPQFALNGINMRVSQQTNAITLIMAYAGDRSEYENVFIAAYQDNGHIETFPVQLSRGSTALQFRKNVFNTGILRITVFDQHYIPLAERVVFVDKHDMVHFNLSEDTLSFTPKGKNSFSINTKRTDTSTREGSYSVSIRDMTTTDKDEEYGDNICTSLLISPELHGSLYRPGYYFQSDADSLKDQLDLVMLTNGWRHFNWDTVLNKLPVKLTYAPERSQYLAGQIVTQENLQKMKIKLIIVNQDSSKYIGFITPDNEGKFLLPDYEHSGISNVYVEMADAKDHIKKSAVKMLNTFADSLQHIPVSQVTSTQAIPVKMIKNIQADTIASLQYGHLLKTVNIHDQRQTLTQQVIDQHVGPLYHSFREFTFDLVNNPPPFMGIIDYLMGRVPGLQITKVDSNNSYAFVYRGTNTLMGMEKGSPSNMPYIYINEAYADIKMVEDLNIDEVAMIRFMPPPVGFAPYNGGNVGALMIYLKNYNDEKGTFVSREKFDKYSFNGYTITREFSSPDYSLPQNRMVKDNRTTLYWNPNLKTNADGTACFSFYNSDITKGYVVIVQGMDSEGHLGYMYKVIH
jgi:hypothetical protein